MCLLHKCLFLCRFHEQHIIVVYMKREGKKTGCSLIVILESQSVRGCQCFLFRGNWVHVALCVLKVADPGLSNS